MNLNPYYPTLLVLGIATLTDLRSRRIPNWLVLPFLLTGLLAGPQSLLHSFEGMAVAAVITGAMWWVRGLGMGDVKLCTAIGAWIGPGQITTALVATGIAGGLIALLVMAVRGSTRQSLDGAGDLLFGFWKRGMRSHPTLTLDNPHAQKIPYAPAIAIGTIFSFFAVMK